MADTTIDTTTPLRFVVPEEYVSIANGEATMTLTSFAGGAGSFTTLAASGATTLGTTLAVAGTSTLHAVNMTGALAVTGAATVSTTLGVTGATTLAAASATALTASTSLTLTGASVVGLDMALTFQVADLSVSGTYWLVSPWTGTIVAVYAIADGARTTGSAILTGNIAATPITSGVVTLTVNGAAGDIFSASPSAANAVTAGVSKINFVRSGTNDAAVGCTVTVVIRRSA